MAEKRIKRRRRTETIDIEFNELGEATGWAFDVLESFKETLDIKYIQYVDREKTKRLRKKLGRSKDEHGKPIVVYRMAWTRGVPPMRTFQQGHVFYEPPGARRQSVQWEDALNTIQRSVHVRDAKPDTEDGQRGWVIFEVRYYERGRVCRVEHHQSPHGELERFLRTGEISHKVS